jgi:hypothetical protein
MAPQAAPQRRFRPPAPHSRPPTRRGQPYDAAEPRPRPRSASAALRAACVGDVHHAGDSALDRRRATAGHAPQAHTRNRERAGPDPVALRRGPLLRQRVAFWVCARAPRCGCRAAVPRTAGSPRTGRPASATTSRSRPCRSTGARRSPVRRVRSPTPSRSPRPNLSAAAGKPPNRQLPSRTPRVSGRPGGRLPGKLTRSSPPEPSPWRVVARLRPPALTLTRTPVR